MGPEIEIDLRGLKCPLPVLRARKALASLAPGNLLRLWADDPVAVIDIPHFCREAGHELVGTEETGAATLYLIRKG
ncbi:sulfurtransferase TusA family protein [Rhodovulum sulfidophilum]|uniref:Sulfurtransferase TusA family protein n=1 Tax=Rhodovulum sulfidophilum TaxID=35806 RepID=A0ABS1RPC1_RHOSU|nr:sulfurtransferase TusA family protein [Rhodovulum sulfidophilum]ANB34459.1 preprotein translocase subunit TatB [Rhodovulum sulfidophilum DSM 1374]ANB38282.1 preprotein translocase subunit TatB [Rhodovulum sulfidophilum]MBL3561056.1 sulfurtransferase TusA family protein [Rhodovulum sulfidophilum]MBL3565247.1 sulfurtransferase TusA family protein [Rhodovulum sulfidophilum]MBL3575616.1 sulfurtransferase TusA family protein [Rhodovulum sulfidophilum]